jgi:hypothetical protein
MQRRARPLHFDSLLPVEVHLLQLRLGGLPGKRTYPLCGPADSGLAAAGEWAARMGVQLPRRVDTVYLGGGTPSLLAPELLERLFAAMRAEFDFEPDAEITVECAPGQLADSTLGSAGRAGVNRVSLGVQSFIDREAARQRAAAQPRNGRARLRRLRAAGISNLNVDLIAGLAGQTFASWEESLEALIGLRRSPRQRLHARGGRGLSAGPRDAGRRRSLPCRAGSHRRCDCADVFAGHRALGRPDWRSMRFQISAGPAFTSRHNLRYWQRRPYLGLGLDASSMLRAAPDFHSSDRDPSLGAPSFRHLSGERMGGQKSPPEPIREADSDQPYLLRSTTTDDLKAYLAGPEPESPRTGLVPWGGEPVGDSVALARAPARGGMVSRLRLNAGVDVAGWSGSLAGDSGAGDGSRWAAGEGWAANFGRQDNSPDRAGNCSPTMSFRSFWAESGAR